MKILPKITKLTAKYINISDDNYTLLNINENLDILYKNGKTLNKDILEDLIESKGYATTLLYLNETSQVCIHTEDGVGLLNESNINDFYNDCEELLTTNIKIVEEEGIPLVNINGYKIYESDFGILRGNGKKKIRESFDGELDQDLKDAIKEHIISHKDSKYGFDSDSSFLTDGWAVAIYETARNDGSMPSYETIVKMREYYSDIFDETVKELKEDGTQCSDIAPKVDQNIGINKPNKKYYDILISDINESEDPIINKGFFKNSKGQYERNGFILVKEGEKYLAIRKDLLK